MPSPPITQPPPFAGSTDAGRRLDEHADESSDQTEGQRSEERSFARPLVLGIESSCDDTACAILDGDGRVLATVVSSQLAAHRPYGGVVPEIASREHLRNWPAVRAEAFARAGCGLHDIDVVAATRGPGLVGSLLVGLSVGKALAYGLGKPFFGVHHLEGHLYSPYLVPPPKDAGSEQSKGERRQSGDQTPLPQPARDAPEEFTGLVVSGGHTALYAVSNVDGEPASTLCETRDDAMGECFDKVGKRLGLPFPGGPLLDQLAELVPAEERPKGRVTFAAKAADRRDNDRNGDDHERRENSGRPGDRELFLRTPRCGTSLDFSYSGLKTQAIVEIERLEREGLVLDPDELLRLARSGDTAAAAASSQWDALLLMAAFRDAAVRQVIDRVQRRHRQSPIRTLAVSGGVAANRALRKQLADWGEKEGVSVVLVPLAFCGDNAAMIAHAALRRFARGEQGDPWTVDAVSRLPVG